MKLILLPYFYGAFENFVCEGISLVSICRKNKIKGRNFSGGYPLPSPPPAPPGGAVTPWGEIFGKKIEESLFFGGGTLPLPSSRPWRAAVGVDSSEKFL